MTDKDTADMIDRCISEIESLRIQVAVLKPRSDAYGMVEQILSLLPRQSQGHGEDIVWKLKRQLEELKPKPEVTEA